MNAVHTQFSNSAHSEDGSLVYLTLDAIEVKEGFNPRKFFEDNQFNELVAAVKAEGVLQPIVVRPIEEGRFSLIAGERRFRASIQAGCEDIPAVIRHVNDKQAAIISLMENATRADLSIMEEADSARIVLSHSDNDKAEAARKLGWSSQKLDQRLALLHAHDDVKTALTEHKIKLGHAVLLCQLTDAMQETTLEAIVKDNISVADLKARLSGFTLELNSSLFDTAACQQCPRNSSIQANLFEDSLSGGQCADHACFGGKTMAALTLKQTDLKETYHAVFLDTERDPSTYVELCKTGVHGVGNEQLESGCKGCENFGALLSSKAGCVGQVTNELCFDLTCHKTKVNAQQAALVEPKVHQPTTSGDNAKNTTPIAPDKTKSVKPEQKKEVSSKTPKRVIDRVHAIAQQAAEQAALADVNISLSLAVYTLLDKIKHNSDCLIESLKPKWSTRINRTNALALLYTCSVDDLKLMLVKTASHLPNCETESFPLEDGLVNTSKVILSLTKTDLSKHFTLDKTFLELHTKGGMEIILKEATNPAKESFVAVYEAKHGEGSFKSLMKLKNIELIKKVFDLGFDFSGFLPTCLSEELSDTKSK